MASNKEIPSPWVQAVLGLQPRSLHAVARWLVWLVLIHTRETIAIDCDGLLLRIDNHPCRRLRDRLPPFPCARDPLVSLEIALSHFARADEREWIEEREGEEHANERKAKTVSFVAIVANRIRIGHAAGTPAACASRRALDPAAAPVVGSTLTREGGAVGLSVPVEDDLAQCHSCRDID